MKILIIEGPLLDKIGEREPEIYGEAGSREKLIDATFKKAKNLNVDVEFVQEYCEGALAKLAANAKCDGIVINPGSYAHTSILLRDALLAAGTPFVEVHISNIFAREKFRQKSYLSDIAQGLICGMGNLTYAIALEGIVAKLNPL